MVVNARVCPSFTVLAPIGAKTGGRLTVVPVPTVIVKVSESVCAGVPLSVTVTVTLEFPVAVGVQLKTPVGVRVAPVGRLPAEKVRALHVGSVAVAVNVNSWPTVAVLAPIERQHCRPLTLPT